MRSLGSVRMGRIRAGPSVGLSQAARAAGGTSPRQLAGLILWLDPAAIVGLNAGDPVTTWPDLSGLGNDASQGVAAQRPTWQPNILNGRPIVRFDGVDDALRVAALTYGPFTKLYVFRSPDAGVTILDEHSANANVTPGDHVLPTTGATNRVNRGGVYDSKDYLVNWGYGNVWRRATVLFTGTHATHRMFVDGAEVALVSIDANDVGVATATDEWNLASRNEASLFLQMDLAELLIYARALADVDHLALDAYFRARYAL